MGTEFYHCVVFAEVIFQSSREREKLVELYQLAFLKSVHGSILNPQGQRAAPVSSIFFCMYSVGHVGPALIWHGENHTGGVGQWAILEAAYYGKFNRNPGHPQAVCAACSLSSCQPRHTPP